MTLSIPTGVDSIVYFGVEVMERIINVPANCVAAKSQVREILCVDGEWEITHRRFWQSGTQSWGSWIAE